MKTELAITAPEGINFESGQLIVPRDKRIELVKLLEKAENEALAEQIKEKGQEFWPDLQAFLKSKGVAHVVLFVEGDTDREGNWEGPVERPDVYHCLTFDAKGKINGGYDDRDDIEGEADPSEYRINNGPFVDTRIGGYQPTIDGTGILALLCGGMRGAYQIDVETGLVRERGETFYESGNWESDDEGGSSLYVSVHWKDEDEIKPLNPGEKGTPNKQNLEY